MALGQKNVKKNHYIWENQDYGSDNCILTGMYMFMNMQISLYPPVHRCNAMADHVVKCEYTVLSIALKTNEMIREWDQISYSLYPPIKAM